MATKKTPAKKAAPKKAKPKNEHLETRKCVHNEHNATRKWVTEQCIGIRAYVTERSKWIDNQIDFAVNPIRADIDRLAGPREEGEIQLNLARVVDYIRDEGALTRELLRTESRDTREQVLQTRERLDAAVQLNEQHREFVGQEFLRVRELISLVEQRVNEAHNKAFDITLLQDSIVHLRKSNYRLRFTIVLILLAIVLGGITYALSPIIHW